MGKKDNRRSRKMLRRNAQRKKITALTKKIRASQLKAATPTKPASKK